MNFTEYTSSEHALSFEKMQEIYARMISEIGSDETAAELYRELLEKAIRYTSIRAGWLSMTREEKAEADPGRTAAHDSVITGFNMLARYLQKQGKTASWRNDLGDLEQDPAFRKRLGDMGNFLVFMEALSQR